MNRILFLLVLVLVANVFGEVATQQAAAKQPNVVIIFCDDLGWGDLGCFGHPTIATPNLDQMASEGTKLTQFYVASSVCTPSRAALLTGRYPLRTGMWGKRRVLFPDSIGGLPQSEITIAECLKDAGYATGMVGKWHLGHLPQHLPTKHGFDWYYGIPYSNDMDKIQTPQTKGRQVFDDPNWHHFNVPLISSMADGKTQELERPTNQSTITRRYTKKSVDFIRAHQDEPFFLYLAHSLPHVPLFRHADFQNHSRAGLYGDVIEEIDWSVGQVLDTLGELKLAQNTLVVFTSDNGPWLSFGDQGGSAGPLRNGKGTTYEGGMRVPGIVWMPGTIPADVTNRELASTLDLLPTVASLAGAQLPKHLILDGYDLTNCLTKSAPSPRDAMFYYRDNRLLAIRSGRYKAHWITQNSYVKKNQPTQHDPPLLFDLETDISEKRNRNDDFPEVLARMEKIRASHQANLPIASSQLDRR